MTGNRVPLILVALLLAVAFVPGGNAAQVAGHQQNGYIHNTVKVTALVEAGEMSAHLVYPDAVAEVGDVFRLGGVMTGPLLLATTGSITFSTQNLVGCTAGTPVSQSAATGPTGMWGYYNVPVTLTDRTCTGIMQLTVAGGLIPVTLWEVQMPFSVHAVEVPQNLNLTGALGVNCTGCSDTVNVTSGGDGNTTFPDTFYITETTTQVGGTSTWNILLILLMTAIGVAIWAKTEPLPLRYGGTILVATAGLLCFEFAAALYIMVPLGLTLMALGAYGFYEIPKSQNMKKDPFDIGSL